MTSRPNAGLVVQPAHLPHYSHTAVIVGTAMLLAIIVLEALAALAAALSWSRRADDSPPDELGTHLEGDHPTAHCCSTANKDSNPLAQPDVRVGTPPDLSGA